MKAFNQIAWMAFLLTTSQIAFAANNKAPQPPKGECNQDSIIGDGKEFTKSYNKTFNVNPNILVILSNKYGKIDVKTGGGSQAVVNVVIKVQASSQAEADKAFNRINIGFTDGPDYVKAETEIESQNNGWWSWGSNSSDFAIDYDVTMPAANKLDLSNKYGNSHIAPLSNWVKIDQKYGDFKLDGAATATINLAYGGGTIGKLMGLNGTVSYGKLSSADIKDVAMKSKYSAFKFDKIENFAVTSAYDDYQVNTVTNFTIDSKYGDMIVGNVENIAVKSAYTDFKIRKIGSSADFQTNYGDVRIDAVKNGFDALNLKGNYTDYVVTIDPSVSYQLDVTTSYGDVNHSTSLTTKIDKEKGSTKEIMGFVGNENTKSLVKARLNYGDLIIK